MNDGVFDKLKENGTIVKILNQYQDQLLSSKMPSLNI